jgi:hypothetical protein
VRNELWDKEHLPGSRSKPPLSSGSYRTSARFVDDEPPPAIDDDHTTPLDELFRR